MATNVTLNRVIDTNGTTDVVYPNTKVELITDNTDTPLTTIISDLVAKPALAGTTGNIIVFDSNNNAADSQVSINSLQPTTVVDNVTTQSATAALSANQGYNLDGRITTNANNIEALNALILQEGGAGGALTATDLGAAPTQQSLFTYYAQQIWGVGGTVSWNASTPNASTYTDTSSVIHLATDMFNNTWVRNTNASNLNHKWVLTNTPTTQPAVFQFTDVGIDTVGLATSTLAGVMKLYNTSTGTAADGTMDQATIKSYVAAQISVLTTTTF
jgi:hypothetical protein